MTTPKEERRLRETADSGRYEAVAAIGFYRELRRTVGWIAAVYLTGKFVSARTAELIRAMAA